MLNYIFRTLRTLHLRFFFRRESELFHTITVSPSLRIKFFFRTLQNKFHFIVDITFFHNWETLSNFVNISSFSATVDSVRPNFLTPNRQSSTTDQTKAHPLGTSRVSISTPKYIYIVFKMSTAKKHWKFFLQLNLNLKLW